LRDSIALTPGTRVLLRDLDAAPQSGVRVLASACKALPLKQEERSLTLVVEGVAPDSGHRSPLGSHRTACGHAGPSTAQHDPNTPPSNGCSGFAFPNESKPRELVIRL